MPARLRWALVGIVRGHLSMARVAEGLGVSWNTANDAVDGFAGFVTAAAEELPDAVAVMDPFHVVRLGGEALDRCRRRVQQRTCGHRGRAGDPLFDARRTLLTGAPCSPAHPAHRRTLLTGVDLLGVEACARLDAVLAPDAHVEVASTWGVYQKIIAAYRAPGRRAGRALMAELIASIGSGVPAALAEVATGR